MKTPALQVERVTRRYEGASTVIAVREVSLTVERGEIVLIMGPSGSGKTTLLSMIGALLRPSSGSITLDGRPLVGRPERELSELRLRSIGFVFQDFNLLAALSAVDNVALVAQLAGMRRGEAHQRASTILTDLGLGSRLAFLPEQLSGGEKQRVAIARALVNDPVLILADEPTANLDRKTGHELMKLLRRVTTERGRSAVIVSHDRRIEEIAERVLWLEDGRLTELAGLPIDPVCGMAVERADAPWLDWGGDRHVFCSNGCRAEFIADPAKFGRPPDEPDKEMDMAHEGAPP